MYVSDSIQFVVYFVVYVILINGSVMNCLMQGQSNYKETIKLSIPPLSAIP